MNKFAVLEALLFAWGEPLAMDEIAKVLRVDKNELYEILNSYENQLLQEDRGLRLVTVEDSVQLSTKPEIYSIIKDYAKDQQMKNLSNAALETLSIIAYRQPVIKSDIEDIRGVKCDQVIKNLMEVGLVEITGRLDRPGRPNIYGTTPFFLSHFGLQTLDDLPREDGVTENLSFLEE